MLKIALVAAAALPLAACATVPAATSQELAYCQQMQREMGTDRAHDHAQARGAASNPMNVTHARCQQVLGQS